ncbi:MAG: hypothetical protein FJY36_02110 [Betaproteobacteria bacterium]|nr:hypothetical protein [Betaproteobacteria bacterium]
MMTHRLLLIGLWCLGMGVATGHAETARKASTHTGVDLDAAARATAALYAKMAVPEPLPPSAKPVAAAPLPVFKPTVTPSRPSPLLPAVATATAPAAAPAFADVVWQGAYQCEHAEKVQLRPDTVADQVQLQWKGQSWKMRNIDSRSGATRLEDTTGRMVWIQLGEKSMLLDQRQGKRLLDGCQHAVQVQTAAQLKTNPPPALFDSSGMGR